MSNKRRILPVVLTATLTMTTLPAQLFAQETDLSVYLNSAQSGILNELETRQVADQKVENPPTDPEAYKAWKENFGQDQIRNKAKKSIRRGVAASESLNGSIQNEYIRFRYLAGRYGEFTTGGDPENPRDDNKKLLYGEGNTSFTTIRIDGQDYIFQATSAQKEENGVVLTQQIGDIIIKQHIRIAYNQYTDREDVVEYFYTAENTSQQEHTVGVRIMLDTMLGNNDDAPFRIPGIGNVTTETDLTGSDIPEFWQVFDKIGEPSVVAQGTLKTDRDSTPDRVRFTNWRIASQRYWDYQINPGSSNGDSAVCLYWNERNLQQGEKVSCKTYYGLSSLKQDDQGELNLALTGVSRLDVTEDEQGNEAYSPNPFTITAYVQNNSSNITSNAKVTLNLPDDLELVEGPQTVELGNLLSHSQQQQISWQVKARPGAQDRVSTYGVTLSADNTEDKTVSKEITIPAMHSLVRPVIRLEAVSSEVNEGKATIRLTYTNIGETAASDLKLRFSFDDDHAKLVDPKQAEILAGDLGAGESAQVEYEVELPQLEEEKDYDYHVEATYEKPDASRQYTEVLAGKITAPAVEQIRLPYVIFAADPEDNLNFSGWKYNVTGDIYTGGDLNSSVSELYVNGKIDAVGSATFTGWQKQVESINELTERVIMPDLEETLYQIAGNEFETFDEDTAYIKDTNIIDQAIRVNGNLDISGTTFEGNCVIIASGDINYDVMDFAGSGTVYLYSEQGNIYIDGTKIDLNGLVYAPNGKVIINVNETSLKGAVYAQDVKLNGSVLNIERDENLIPDR